MSPEIYEISPLLDFYRIETSSSEEDSSSEEEKMNQNRSGSQNHLTAENTMEFQRVSLAQNMHLTVEGTMDLPMRTSEE